MLCFWPKTWPQQNLVGWTGLNGHPPRACLPYMWQCLIFPANSSTRKLEAATRGNSSCWSWLRVWDSVQAVEAGSRVVQHWGSRRVSLVTLGSPGCASCPQGMTFLYRNNSRILRFFFFKIQGNSCHLFGSHFPCLKVWEFTWLYLRFFEERSFARMAVTLS